MKILNTDRVILQKSIVYQLQALDNYFNSSQLDKQLETWLCRLTHKSTIRT